MNKAAEKQMVKALGIDLAGVESRPTGLCQMDVNLNASTCMLYTDNEIICKAVKCRPDVVAVDAPLALPQGRESLSTKSNVHLRECDRELLRMKIKFLPLTLGPMRLLTLRGIRLRADLEKKGVIVIETYPGAAQDILHIPRKGKGLERLREGLCLVGVKGLGAGMSGDELDAVTCALVGIMYLRGEYRTIGAPDEMLMTLPR